MTPQPSVQASTTTNGLIVRISGDLDYESAAFVRNRLVDELAHNQKGVVLDLSALSFCDTAGLSVLLEAWQRTERAGARLVMARVPPNLERMLTMTCLDTVIPVCATVAEAEAKLQLGGAA